MIHFLSPSKQKGGYKSVLCGLFLLINNHLVMSEEVASDSKSKDPDHSNPSIKHITGTNFYKESFEQRCAKWQNVCTPKEVLFDVATGQTARMSLQLLEACSPIALTIQLVDDKEKVINSFKISTERPRGQRHFFSTSTLSPFRIYKVIMIAEGGTECQDGYLPRWAGEVFIEQPVALCPS